MKNKKRGKIRKLKDIKTKSWLYYLIIILFFLTIIISLFNLITLMKPGDREKKSIANNYTTSEKSPEYEKLLSQIKEKSFKLNSSDIILAENAVYLKIDKCRALELLTSAEQVARIEKARSKQRLYRPEKEDLISDILEIYDIKLELVFIESLSEETYFAKIILKQGNKIVVLDSKPTDALILASMFDADIFVNKELENLLKRVC